MNKAIYKAMAVTLLVGTGAAWANQYTDTEGLFRHAGASGTFFNHSYGYAVFPTIAKGGLGVGAGHGDGHVYKHGKYVGDTSMTQVSFGLQAGGEAYSQIVFFENQKAFDDFTSGNFEFGADINAVAITAAAGGSADTAGGLAGGVSGGDKNAATVGKYYKGLAVFTIVKGGAMYNVTVNGEKFGYTPKG